MKAVICEFCSNVITEKDKRRMVYTIDIMPADEYEATLAIEKQLIKSIGHACFDCTAKVLDFITGLQHRLKNTGNIPEKKRKQL